MKLILVLALVVNMANAATIKNSAFIDTMYLTDKLMKVSSKSYETGMGVDVFTNNDEVIFYHAVIGVVNPTKEKFDVDIVCIDSKNNIVLQRSFKRSLSGFSHVVDGDIIKGYTQTLSMAPKIDAMVKGQLIPLKLGNNYFIKLYFEKKLVGITEFNYADRKY